MMDWYYSLLGEEFGPVPVSTIQELLNDGTLGPGDSVRRSDSDVAMTCAEFLNQHSQSEELDDDDSTSDAAEEPCDLFWFQLEGIALGPVPGHSLIRLAEIRRISPDTLIRRDNEFLWEAASEFHELSIVFMLGSDLAKDESAAAKSTSRAEITATDQAEPEVDAEPETPEPTPPKSRAAKSGKSNPATSPPGQRPRGKAASRKLVNRQKQAESRAAEDAMLQEIFAELEERKAAERPATSTAAASGVSKPQTEAAVQRESVSRSYGSSEPSQSAAYGSMSDPQRHAASALSAALASKPAAAPPKRTSAGSSFRIPNPFAGLSQFEFNGPVKTLLGLSLIAAIWFGWEPLMSMWNNQQGHYIARIEETLQEIEKLNPATQPDVYTKRMEKIAQEFKAYSVVMTAAASQRKSAKTCLAAVNRLVEYASTSPANDKLQKKLLSELKSLVQEYKG